jgi:DNA-directed RNA polymerase subunit M/transcription elongation factor TFIIS
MNYCPCCSDVLLKHVNSHETYWFCRQCWQEMPVFDLNTYANIHATKLNAVSNYHSIGSHSKKSLLSKL